MSGPISILPEEVWELILDQVTDSKDAWNLFRAFPELDMNAGLQKKKHKWLFGLVLPHLIPWINANWINEDKAVLLNCRLVSKRWSTFFDNFLDTQNQLRAYDSSRPGPQIPGGFYWDTQRVTMRSAGELMFGINDIIGGTEISDLRARTIKITKFLQEFADHHHGRNPFPARYLPIAFFDERVYRKFWYSSNTFKFLELFGKHIWHYQMTFFGTGNDLDPRDLADCLRFLPNLRSLRLINPGLGPYCESEDAKIFETGNCRLPQLSHLETLRIDEYYPRSPGKIHLICQYSGQIRRLQLGINLWEKEYSEMFPNLTELELTSIGPLENDKLSEVLLSIQCPLLAKLMLESAFCVEMPLQRSTLSIQTDIFPWLKQFPKLQYLNLGDQYSVAHCIEEGTLSPEKDSIPSLKFLSIRTSPKMSYNFLRCLPSLQYLHLHVHPEPSVIDQSTEPTKVRILDEIQTGKLYRSNIWELLPKLRMVTLLVVRNMQRVVYGIFSREGYEKVLKQGNGPSFSGAGDHSAPLRSDIIQFLHQQALGETHENAAAE